MSSTKIFHYLPDHILWKHSIMVLSTCFVIHFFYNGVKNCIQTDFNKTIKIMSAPIITLSTALLYGYYETETFKNQFVIFHLVHSISFNITIYRLMISNMTNSNFRVVSTENIVCLVPLFVHFYFPDEKDVVEPLSNYICLALLVVLFYGHISLLSLQYLA